MKKLFMPLAFVAVMGMQGQTTIIDEKFQDNKEPLGYKFLPKSNKLVIQNGKGVKSIISRKIFTLNEYTSTSEKQILLDNSEVMHCDFSDSEGGFNVTDFSNFAFGNKIKFYSKGKSSEYYEQEQLRKYTFSDNYGFYISNKSGNVTEKLDENNLSLKVLDIFSKKESNIKIDLPNLDRLQGENMLKQVISARSYKIKTYGIGYKLNILDNEKFEIVTKGIDKEYKSMALYRTIYNNQGKKIQDLKYSVDLKGLYLVNSFNSGGVMGISNSGLTLFYDDLSINNYIIDKETKNIFVYGLFGKESEKSPSGYYIFKFSENGEKLFESINYINNKEFQEESYKQYLYNAPFIVGNKLLFIAGKTNVLFSRYYHYTYGVIDIDTGKEIKSKFLPYDRDSKGIRNKVFIHTWHTNKVLKNKILDMNTYVLYDCNPAIKKYINAVTNKREISFKSEISQEGIWLIESDNEEYYKVTYFEHN